VADPTFSVQFFPAGFGRWHFCIVWSDGITARTHVPVWGYGCAVKRAHNVAQEARRG